MDLSRNNSSAERNSGERISGTVTAHKPREAYFRDDIERSTVHSSQLLRENRVTCARPVIAHCDNFISVLKRAQRRVRLDLGRERKSRCSVESSISRVIVGSDLLTYFPRAILDDKNSRVCTQPNVSAKN